MKFKARLLSAAMVIVLFAALLTGTVLAAGTVEWSGTFTGAGNNTVTTAPLPADPNKVELAWSKPLGNNTVVIVGDYLYTYDGLPKEDEMGNLEFYGGTFYKVHKDTGETVASVACDVNTTYYYSYSIYANGLIYVGTPSHIMAFDPDTLEQKLKVSVRNMNYATLQCINGCIVTNGTVLNGSTTTTVSGLNFGDGWANGAEVGGYYYVADVHENLYAINTTTWTVADTVSSGHTANTSDSSPDACPGVLYYDGALYWGGVSGNVYCVKASNGAFDDSTFKKVSSGIKCYGAPVAANGRIYLAGVQVNNSSANLGKSTICVFDADLNLIYEAGSTENGKIQSTPILQVVSGTTVRVYVQGYSGMVYYLSDSAAKTSGSLTMLLEPAQKDYAWEQLACDSEGAIYCSNDSSYIMKYQTNSLTAPVITGDLSTEEVTYSKGETASALTVTATGSGTLSYQWQSSTNGSTFLNISGATAANYTPDTSKVGTTYYRCVVKNTGGGESAETVSAVAVISVNSSLGDVNGDGKINAADIQTLSEYLVGLEVNCSRAAADVNGDGEINLADVILLRRSVEWNISLTAWNARR